VTYLETGEKQHILQNPNSHGKWQLTLGGSPNCWVTLPNNALPEILAKIIYISHHSYLLVLKDGCPPDFENRNNVELHRLGELKHEVGGFLVEGRDYLA